MHAADEAEATRWAKATAAPLDWHLKVKSFKYMVYQVERAPDTGKVHLQGFICFETGTRLSELKTLSPRAHWEGTNGSVEDNEKYCSKAESRIAGPWTFGQRPEQGKRKDVEIVYDMVKQGATDRELLAATNGSCARISKAIIS